ncbi:hypothetical protein ACJJTC_003431 [Scirpophaga incertulas]
MSSSEEDTHVKSPDRKKIRKGRIKDVMKQIRLQSHEHGEDCFCKRLQCFKNQRRSRKENIEESKHHDCHYSYIVKVVRDDGCHEVQVCFKAFCAIFGITKSKVQYIQTHLKLTGVAPQDKRGKHENRPKKVSDTTLNLIKEHLKSFKGRTSHYSNKKSSKIYLPEEFNIKKVYELFIEKNPDLKEILSYERYRQEFKKYNVSFGYPRSDTCSSCDKINAELNSLKKTKEKTLEIERKIHDLKIEKKLHILKASVFYDRKKKAKLRAKTDKSYVAIAMDYQKNVSLPNITTNDVYYRRQLSMYTFNIHVLATGRSYFFCYPETTSKKGSMEVMSFLHYFIVHCLDKSVKHLSIFCDSAGGQNKNYNMIKFAYFLTHESKLLDSVSFTFPVRGHSYMECDKNFGVVKLKTRMELPNDFYNLLISARSKPEPFIVVNVEQQPEIVCNWVDFLSNGNYKKTAPFKIQEIREFKTSSDKGSIQYRPNYNGLFYNSIITQKNKKNQLVMPKCQENEFYMPPSAYQEPLAITKEKYSDLQVLKEFCSHQAKSYFNSLPH